MKLVTLELLRMELEQVTPPLSRTLSQLLMLVL
jgi:hypothetical protein